MTRRNATLLLALILSAYARMSWAGLGTETNQEIELIRHTNTACFQHRCPEGDCEPKTYREAADICEAESIATSHGKAKREGDALILEAGGKIHRYVNGRGKDERDYESYKYIGYIQAKHAHWLRSSGYESYSELLLMDDRTMIGWEYSKVSFDDSGERWIECYNSTMNGRYADHCAVLRLQNGIAEITADLTQSPCIQRIQKGETALKDVHWQND